MRFKRFLMLLFILMVTQPSRVAVAQQARLVHWNQLEALMSDTTDSITVINFWATWCKPCIKEIPSFEQARRFFLNKPVRFRYISLDFATEKKTRLDPFVKKNLPAASVWLLDETDYNAWIEKVEPTWGGSIPFTLILNKAKNLRIIASEELTFDQLVKKIQPYL